MNEIVFKLVIIKSIEMFMKFYCIIFEVDFWILIVYVVLN